MVVWLHTHGRKRCFEYKEMHTRKRECDCRQKTADCLRLSGFVTFLSLKADLGQTSHDEEEELERTM